ncbi:iron chelate uptake ABC transporter family permease subunit [Microbacterium sp. NC79]|uniref:FecCD family ABC transporter permease n=1 Tax=Microbacterium sp. NC79 TaxID=2851009 RepID=UPI001C2C024B|nr:iron chelate uptake ABC transporter family permease subunit [Microbacterium sp. NC79]MBV0895945.1 iron ABC transporter permease [Microbacterium sp. NC79]
MTVISGFGTTTTAGRTALAAQVRASRRSRERQRLVVSLVLAALVVAVFVVSLMIGKQFYSPAEVMRVLLGEQVPGASFTVGELRLPRSVTAILAGAAFGVAGVTFQTLLRNPLASPEIIGIAPGASATAVIGIVALRWSDSAVSLLALGGAVLTAGALYLLSNKGGFAGARLILMGIGLAAMLNSVVSYLLSRAGERDIQEAMRWLTGSLNGASWERVWPLALAWALVIIPLVFTARGLTLLSLGDDSAASLGVRLNITRVALIAGAVVLLAFATATTGPIAFVAFMAGPIAARLVRPGSSLLIPSALVGALLVITADLIGQFAFDARLPVGVITGVVGAPYLIWLLIRTNRSGGSL